MTLRFLVCAMIFAAGVLVGRLSDGMRSAPEVTAADATSAADYARPISVSAVPPDAVADRAMDGAERTSDGLPNPEAGKTGAGELDLVRRMSALQKDGILSFSTPVFDQDKHIRKEIKQLLGITDAEEAALNKLMDQTVANIREVEWASATSKTEGGKIVITLPTYPEEGGKIYDRARDRMESILGDERSEMLQKIAGFDSYFNDFGTSDRQITLGRYVGNRDPMFSVTDESKKREISESGQVFVRGSSSSTSIWSRESLIKSLGPQAEKWVPAEPPK